MNFKPCTTAPSLYLPDPDAATIRFGYLLTGTTFPEVLSLADSWNSYVGIYFFLGEEVKKDDLSALAQKLNAFYGKHPITHTACLWTVDYTKLDEVIPPPSDRYSQCAYEFCVCRANGAAPCPVDPETPIFITTAKDEAGTIRIANTADVYIGTYRLPLIAGSSIDLLADQEMLAISGTIPGANVPAYGKGINLSLSGQYTGVFQGEACLHDFSPAIYAGWNVGLRYNMSGPLSPCSQFYPVFEIEEGQQWMFQMQWSPLNAIDQNAGDMTFLKFTELSFRLTCNAEDPPVWSIQPSVHPGLIKSCWKTIYGEAIWLKPLINSGSPAKLVFQQFVMDNFNELDYYLAPAGDFELCIPGHGGEQFKLLCGLNGAECIEFTAGDGAVQGDILSFYPGKNAYTNSYPLTNAQSGADLLQSGPTVPWVLVKPAGETVPTYYSAPISAGLYEGTSPSVLSSFFALAARLTSEVTADDSYCFPMVPYAGIDRSWPMDFSPSYLKPFEEQIISNARRRIISTIPVDIQQFEAIAADADDIVTVTPQGLLATTSGLNWKSVVLATDSTGKQLSFTPKSEEAGIPIALRNAFQTNELFMVASDRTNLGDFQNKISIEDWQFDITVPVQDSDKDPIYENILILKFRKGRVLDLVANYDFWTDPESFNLKSQVNGIQTWLTQYCNDAIASAASDTAFSNFATLIQDPDWYGVLAINANIDLGAFPNDLKGLVAAMDLTQFRAHHVGVELSFIEHIGNVLSTGKTGLFGLVSYVDSDHSSETKMQNFDTLWKRRLLEENAPEITDATYAYKVLKLQVLFAGSVVANFISKLQFTARNWFGDPASLNKPSSGDQKQAPNYSMLFNGHYENHDGHPTYTFLTDTGMDYLYYVDSNVVNTIDFIKAQFSTSNPKDPQVGVIEHISGLFSFIGYLNFRKINGADLFSYGDDQDGSKQTGLYFSQMAVNVNFDLNTTAYTTEHLNLNFDPVQAAFDASFSTTRKNSLVRSVPISPASFMAGAGSLPASLGYVHIRPPIELQSTELGSEWYGLNTDFHWGGPGALADDIGFVPNVLLAWSPGTGSLRLDLSIRLPGSGGTENLLSLQSVLKLKIKNFNLVKVENEDKTKTSYNLMLNGITLSVLGLGFPPVGNTSLALLGNPDDSSVIGWFGTYKK